MPIAVMSDLRGGIRPDRILTGGEGEVIFPANSPRKPGNTTPRSLPGGD